MIDFVKAEISYLPEDYWLNHPELIDKWDRRVEYESGELKYPFEAKIYGLKFKIYGPKYREVSGSIHKYYNVRNHLGSQNHDIFDIDKIRWVLNDLKLMFGIKLAYSRIHNFEYGVNLNVPTCAKYIIQNNFITYKNLPITKLRNYGYSGYYTETELTQYFIKIYDKSLQYELDNNVIRIEVKTRKMKHVEFSNIYSLNDLSDLEKLDKLREDLRNKILNLKIVDKIDPIVFGMNAKEQILYRNGINPKHWERLSRESSRKVYHEKVRFNNLIRKFELLTTKMNILNTFDETFDLILNPQHSH